MAAHMQAWVAAQSFLFCGNDSAPRHRSPQASCKAAGAIGLNPNVPSDKRRRQAGPALGFLVDPWAGCCSCCRLKIRRPA